MKEKFIVLLAVVACISGCIRKIEENTFFVSDKPTALLQEELFLPEEEGLNVFYDIYADDSLVYCLDLHNDTVLKVYSNRAFPGQVGYCLRGPGPDDFLFPFFACTQPVSGDKIKLVELDTWKVKMVERKQKQDFSKIEIDSLLPLPQIPPIKNYNETDSCIYGNDVDMQQGLFFIYHKANAQLSAVDYCEDKASFPYTYSSQLLPYLFDNHLLVNQQANSLAVAMIHINGLYFFDLAGSLKKKVFVGDRKLYPEPDFEYSDFPDAKKYFVSLTGTPRFLYGLYNGFAGSSGVSRIFKFDWEGNLISVLQTEKKIEKISVTPSDKQLFGIVMSEEGGSNVFRWSLE